MARSARAMGRMAMDPAALQCPVKPGTARRALGYARPYVGTLLLFLIVVVANASIAIANPLIYREIVNVGILTGDTTLIVQLALLVAGVGLVDAALGRAQTYLRTSTRTRRPRCMRRSSARSPAGRRLSSHTGCPP